MRTLLQPARRDVLRWIGGAAAVSASGGARPAAGARGARIADAAVAIEFDARARCRIVGLLGGRPAALTGFDDSETLVAAGGRAIDRFELVDTHAEAAPDGPGRRLVVRARSAAGIEKTVAVTLLERRPGFATLEVSWRNASDAPVDIEGWTTASHRLLPRGPRPEAFWSFSGSSHDDRRDWVQPVKPGFRQDNFMGMNAPDYGGGTPVADVWRRDAGLAVGHLDTVPRAVSLPIRWSRAGVALALSGRQALRLAPGESFAPPPAFVAVHRGDHFAPLTAYREAMAERGLAAPRAPAAAYEGVWCAWGYEREFSTALVEATLPKVRELGLGWAVIDDGWQARVGDWTPNPRVFPGGETDVKALAGAIRAAGLKPRLWIAPLAVAPGSDELHDASDMLLLDKDGAVQNVSWWNSFMLCPAYGKTIEHARAWTRRILADWDFDGLKIDGQHLNGVAPCFNPAHRHARPEASCEGLAGFFQAIYETARAIKPDAVIEICPCGTSFAFHNAPWMNQTPASDPLNSWQVRLKGKSLKALLGPGAAFAGDHVELSDGGDDFASTIGVGGVVSTKFTWPEDPKPKDSFLLTPAREAEWRRWIALYRRLMLPTGTYRGELYDIAFDKPEAHVVEKSGRLYFAFYAPRWDGTIELRGLPPGEHALHDLGADQPLGRIAAANPRLHVRFERHLLIEAAPVRA
jgi:alpha-galactosidase